MKAVPGSNRSMCKRMRKEIKKVVKPELIVQVRRLRGTTYHFHDSTSETMPWWGAKVFEPGRPSQAEEIQTIYPQSMVAEFILNIKQYNPTWLR